MVKEKKNIYYLDVIINDYIRDGQFDKLVSYYACHVFGKERQEAAFSDANLFVTSEKRRTINISIYHLHMSLFYKWCSLLDIFR